MSGYPEMSEPVRRTRSLKSRLRLWLVHRGVRALMAGYTATMTVTRLLRTKRRTPGNREYEILLTGTFYSDNWIASHLRPLARSRHCARVRVVTSYPISPIDKVGIVSPPRWLVRLAGAVPARLLTFFWIGLRTRPHFVGGFHLLFNGLAAALLGRLIGARSLYFCVGGPAEVLGGGIQSENRLFEKLEEPDPVVEQQLLRAVAHFDLIVTMGNSARDFFQHQGVTAPVHVVAGGLDADRYAPSAIPATTDLVFVGRLAPIKRVDLFLQTVKRMQQQMPAITATVVGDGPMREPLERLAADLGVAGNVRFVGQQANIEEWLRQARLFLLTSDSEGLSLALIEAMLCGLPAVVSRVGDLGDLVEDGRNGYLVDERSAEPFADRALEILGNRERLAAFSRAAREAARRYELSACTRLWDGILGAI